MRCIGISFQNNIYIILVNTYKMRLEGLKFNNFTNILSKTNMGQVRSFK